jgi:hypothetical protein
MGLSTGRRLWKGSSANQQAPARAYGRAGICGFGLVASQSNTTTTASAERQLAERQLAGALKKEAVAPPKTRNSEDEDTSAR